MCFISLSQSAVGSGQTGPDERAPEGSEVSFRRGVLEAADFLCQWYCFNFVSEVLQTGPLFQKLLIS